MTWISDESTRYASEQTKLRRERETTEANARWKAENEKLDKEIKETVEKIKKFSLKQFIKSLWK